MTSNMRTRVFIVIGALLAVVGSAAIAPRHARAAGAPDKLLQDGLNLRRSGDDQGAYSLFVEAYGVSHAPRAAAQLGFCEQALGRWADAETHLSEALRAAPTDAWIRKNRLPIEQSLAAVKTHIARVEVVGEPAGAEVSINGTVVGQLPMATPARVAGGEIEVELKMRGYARASKSLRVEAGQYQKVVIRAEREPDNATAAREPNRGGRPAGAMEPPAGSTPATSTSSTATPPGATLDSKDSKDSKGSDGVPGPREPSSSGVGGLKLAAWITGGASLVFLGVGTIELLSASSKLDAFQKAMADGGGMVSCGTDLPGYGGPHCASLHNDWKSAHSLGLTGLIVGGGLAAASATLFIVSTVGSKDNEKVALGCAPELQLQHLGLSCIARF